MKANKTSFLKGALRVALAATLATSLVGTASAGGWLEKKFKQTVGGAKDVGQDVIDGIRKPIKKVLPGEVTKVTDGLADSVIKARERTEIAVDKFIDDPVGYLMHLPASIVSEVCSSPVQYYGKIMEAQARGGWQRLPAELIDAVQGEYNVDLRLVQYVERVTTSNGQAQTLGKRIYFPTSIDLTTESDMHWMLHELEHTVQFSNATYGTAGKLCEYVAKAIGSGGRHDSIDMERAADAKADYLLHKAVGAMNGDRFDGPLVSNDDLASHQFAVTNTTNIAITFEMGTESLSDETTTLQPGESVVFSGEAGDAAFYVHIGTSTWRGVVSREYTIPGGAKTLIAANSNGIYEFYNEQ